MKLYNSLTKQIEQVKDFGDERTVSIYSCGPTVYAPVHIGNLLSFIVADTVSRALNYTGEVKHVMNLTDIDDKTIAASQAAYPQEDPKIALKKLTDQYAKLFMEQIGQVGVDVENIKFIKATDYIVQMQELITNLVENGIGYVADDGVYFSIKAYQDKGRVYGQLTHVDAEANRSRVNNDEYDKQSAGDFALWKKQKASEPSWKFTVDGQDLTGRPGWHIECSAMSVAELGQPFDIHTGGIDLRFPHHENEIAQSTAVGDDQLARIFVHNEHLLVDGKKMSKSLGNFYTLDDVTAKGIHPLAFRLLVLQSSFDQPLNLTDKSLKAAQNRLLKLVNLSTYRYQAIGSKSVGKDTNHFYEKQNKARYNNLNTPEFLAEISKVEGLIEKNGLAPEDVDFLDAYLNGLDMILGLALRQITDITDEQKQLIKKRETARKQADFDSADQLRDELLKHNLTIKDTDNGPIWQFVELPDYYRARSNSELFGLGQV